MAKKSGPKRTVKLGGRTIEISSSASVMFPGTGLTKGELVAYYEAVCEVMVPHIRDRPLTQNRFPRGIGTRGFLQKQAPNHTPSWIARVKIPKKDGGHIDYALCQDAPALIYFANQRCVAFHVPSARQDALACPDQLVFDFDPSDDDFEKVRRAAGIVAELLDGLELRSYLKTSGSRGLHIVTPIVREMSIDDVRGFAKQMCRYLVGNHPDLVTVEMSKSKRGKRVFLDYLRNGFAQTLVAPYSVRPLPGAPVSTPLSWDELSDPQLHPQGFKVADVLKRLGKQVDPWHDIARSPNDLSAAKRRFEAKYQLSG
ncbi:MAG: non-homologous end-joining DNA ligase [Nannocystaceae bacterium]